MYINTLALLPKSTMVNYKRKKQDTRKVNSSDLHKQKQLCSMAICLGTWSPSMDLFQIAMVY